MASLLGDVAVIRRHHIESFHLVLGFIRRTGTPMAIAPAIVIGLCIFGAVLLSVGTIGLIRDGRRIATPIYIVFGLGLLALGIGMWLVYLGQSLPITILFIVTSYLLLIINIIG